MLLFQTAMPLFSNDVAGALKALVLGIGIIGGVGLLILKVMASSYVTRIAAVEKDIKNVPIFGDRLLVVEREHTAMVGDIRSNDDAIGELRGTLNALNDKIDDLKDTVAADNRQLEGRLGRIDGKLDTILQQLPQQRGDK